MKHSSGDLTDTQWAAVEPLIRQSASRVRQGRDRDVLNGVLFVLRTGISWVDLPARYPAPQTCHRRFQQWVRSGVMRAVLEALTAHGHFADRFDWHEAFLGGQGARKRAVSTALPRRQKQQRRASPQFLVVLPRPHP